VKRSTQLIALVPFGIVAIAAVIVKTQLVHHDDASAPQHTNPPVSAEDRAQELLRLGRSQIAAGDSTSAVKTLGDARDLVISTFGDRAPLLATYNDELAIAERNLGHLRRALALHERSLELRAANPSPDDGKALLYRAATKLEAGDVYGADRDATQAKAMLQKAYGDSSRELAPAFALLADIADERGVPELAEQLRRPIDAPAAPPRMAAAVTDKSDPAVALAAGEALLQAGDKAGAAALLGAAAKRLGNEPTRTALHIMIAFAKASGDPQAARTAVSLYQALPRLDRTDFDAIWELSKQ
jgi:tetratricopeptide (TPR) repeat protein